MRKLGTTLQESFGENVFGLSESELALFLADLEEVLLADLEEDWATRPNWKPSTKGFRLSEFPQGTYRATELVEPRDRG